MSLLGLLAPSLRPCAGGDQAELQTQHVGSGHQAGETKFKGQRSSTPFDSIVTPKPEAGLDGDCPVTQPHMHHIKRSESDMHQSQDPVWSPQLPLDKLAESFEVKAQQPQQSGWVHSASAVMPQMQQPAASMPQHPNGTAPARPSLAGRTHQFC